MCEFFANSFNLKNNTTWLHFTNVMINGTFTLTHTNLGGLRRNWFVWKNTYPHFTFTFHVTCERDTGCFQLTAGQAAELQRFQRK